MDRPVHTDIGASIDPDVRLQNFRELFVEDSTRGLMWFALCILAVSFWRNFISQHSLHVPGAFVVVATACTCLVAASLYRRQLSYAFKAGVLLGTLFVSAIFGLVVIGSTAPTGNFFAMGFFISR